MGGGSGRPPASSRRTALVGMGAAGLAAVASPALVRGAAGQTGEPWRVLVNFPPGGLLDGTARLIADRAQREAERVPTVVENRPGAGGNIGAAAAARARPDGRTVLASIDTPFTVNPHLYRDMGFDPAADLAPVALVSSFPLVLLVHPGSGIADLAGLVAAGGRARRCSTPLPATARPDTWRWSTSARRSGCPRARWRTCRSAATPRR